MVEANTVAAADELHIKTRTMESDSHPGTNTFFFLLDGIESLMYLYPFLILCIRATLIKKSQDVNNIHHSINHRSLVRVSHSTQDQYHRPAEATFLIEFIIVKGQHFITHVALYVLPQWTRTVIHFRNLIQTFVGQQYESMNVFSILQATKKNIN